MYGLSVACTFQVLSGRSLNCPTPPHAPPDVARTALLLSPQSIAFTPEGMKKSLTAIVEFVSSCCKLTLTEGLTPRIGYLQD